MSKYILLECNRINGKTNYNLIDDDQDEFKNSWVNNISSYGIVINPGDIIQCESAAINTVGASDSTIEFIGKENDNGFVDNLTGINFSYYVNDTGINNIKLPLVNTLTYCSRTQTCFVGGNLNDISEVLKNRGLGDPFLDTYSQITPPTPGASYLNDAAMPQTNLVNFYDLSKVPSDIGTGYRISGVYSGIPKTSGRPGADMQIKVINTIAEGSKEGIPSEIQIISYGNYEYSDNEEIILNAAADGGSNPTTPQTIILRFRLNDNFKTKMNVGPTGNRLFPASKGFTGPNHIKYEGIPDNTGANNKALNTNKINPNFEKRTKLINFELPVGLNTPDNVAGILTNQMHKPTRFNKNTKSPFFNYNKNIINSKDINDNPIQVIPPLIETPTYTPMPVNGSCEVEIVENNIFNDFQGCRQLYYGIVAYAFPERIALNVFNTAYYGLDNDDKTNAINTGNNQVSDMGDFGNQKIGDLGLKGCYMDNIGKTSGESSCLKTNSTTGPLILTNMYYTEKNIKNIANAFRKAEKYVGLQTEQYNNKDPNFLNNLAVPVDLHRYVDQLSQGFPLTPSNNLSEFSGEIPNQRKRFCTFQERKNPNIPNIFKNVDDGYAAPNNTVNNDICIGTQIFGFEQHPLNEANNDGQMLSQFVFKSRYDETILFNEKNIADYYQEQFNRLKDVTGREDTEFILSSDSKIENIYNNSYTDTLDNIKRDYNDLIALSKKYDICAIPVFPDKQDEYNKFGGRPYIAFKHAFKLDSTPLFDTSIMGLDQTFQIDSRNCQYGAEIGYDPSFIRNQASLLYNTNYADEFRLNQKNTYNNLIFMGAVNPSIEFDPTLSRFTINGLNTPTTIGNGLPTNNQQNLEANNEPEQQVYYVNKAGQIADIHQLSLGGTLTLSGNTIKSTEIRKCNEFINQESNKFIESYTGLAIENIVLYDSKNNSTTLNNNNLFGNDYAENNLIQGSNRYNQDILFKTLFDKLGFKISQLLPEFGSSQAVFNDPIIFNEKNITYLEQFENTCKPMTTSAFISSAEYQPTSTNRVDMPLYGIGTNIGLPSTPSVTQSQITSQNLPQKLDYPYLLIYSSIIQGGTDTEYYGGSDGKSKLPCIGYITRNYNEGDFFYGLEQSFNYTANKSFTLTEISHEIRLPDGSRPRLQPNNSIIYKITKPIVNFDNNKILSYNNKENDRIRRRKEES